MTWEVRHSRVRQKQPRLGTAVAHGAIDGNKTRGNALAQSSPTTLLSCDPSPQCASNVFAADTGRGYDWYRIAFAFIAKLQASASLQKDESYAQTRVRHCQSRKHEPCTLTRFQPSHRHQPHCSSKSTEIELRSSPMVLSHTAATIKGKGVNGSSGSSAPDIHSWRPSLSNNSDGQRGEILRKPCYHESIGVRALEASGEASVYKAQRWSGKYEGTCDSCRTVT